MHVQRPKIEHHARPLLHLRILCEVPYKQQGLDLLISGGRPTGADIETYNDHRIAMSFAVAGLKIPGVVIKDPVCVDKSFPDFWEVLEELYQA